MSVVLTSSHHRVWSRFNFQLSFAHPPIPATLAREGQLIQVPIVYGGEYGPDLQEVAEFAKCTEEEVMTRHSAPNYRVYMLGFLPGFAYLGQVDARIAMPRRTSQIGRASCRERV